VREINSRYAFHWRSAREIASVYFDVSRVLPAIIECAMNPCSTTPSDAVSDAQSSQGQRLDKNTLATFKDDFVEKGFLGPLPLLKRDECHAVLRLARRTPPPFSSFKGNAAAYWGFYRLGTTPQVLDLLKSLLGPNVMLWGASIVCQRPGESHPWHTDIETAAPDGKSASIWIGLENTGRKSSLRLISFSHLFGRSLQHTAHRAGRKRSEISDHEVLKWAKERDQRSCIEMIDVKDGEAIVFDGRLWHGSRNERSSGCRSALLLQYATPDTRIRLPNPEVLDWPLEYLDQPEPPCVMVLGTDDYKQNRILAAPVLQQSRDPMETTSICDDIWPSWIGSLDVSLDRHEKWRSVPIYRGAGGCTSQFSCHVSVLKPNHTPHPLHQHQEEELIIMLSGNAEIVVSDTPEASEQKTTRVSRGHVVYHCAFQWHTIRSVGSVPARYLIFKWTADREDEARDPDALASSVFDCSRLLADDLKKAKGFRPRNVFESETSYLSKLHCHFSTLGPDAGYEPHKDPYDVAIVLLHGRVETLGATVEANSVIFHPARESHGIRNVRDTAAKYFVFEFHGGYSDPLRDFYRTIAEEICSQIPAECKFILVDDGTLLTSNQLSHRDLFPFLEHEGAYWGPPSDSITAIEELERLRRRGARYIVFCEPSFWWLDYYKEFENYLRSHYRCVSDCQQMILFDLTQQYADPGT